MGNILSYNKNGVERNKAEIFLGTAESSGKTKIGCCVPKVSLQVEGVQALHLIAGSAGKRTYGACAIRGTGFCPLGML